MSTVEPRSGRRRRVLSAAKLALTALVLTLLVRFVGWRELLAELAAMKTAWLAAMYGVTMLTFTATAASLRLVLAKLGLDVPLRRVLAVNALSTLYGLLAPGDLLAGVSKWALLSAETGRRSRVLSAIVLNKAALALPLLAFGTLAFALQRPLAGRPIALAATLLGVVATVGAALILHPRAEPAIVRTLRFLASPLPESARARIDSLVGALHEVRQLRTEDYLHVLALCSAIVLLGFTAFGFATRAAGLEVSFLTLPWIALVLFIAKVLPITVSSFGVREGILIVALAGQGVQPAEAVAVGLILFSNSVFVALVGAAVQVAVAFGAVDVVRREPAPE